MSCTKLTGPVNIIHTNNNCYHKCKFLYNFKLTSISVMNKQNYLSIEPSNKTYTSVTYNSSDTGTCNNGGSGKYIVDELKIFHPSLHSYNNKKANAELIIHLNNESGGRNLIICIPITTNNGTQPKASSQLETIINYTSKIGNKSDEGGSVQGLNFNLNNFIPKNKGFYAYTATYPYLPCVNCVDYVVYDMNDVAISLSNSTIDKLTSIISEMPSVIKSITPSLGYSYNKKGASQNDKETGDSEEIYIDCQPTGTSGEILINESKNSILNNNPFAMLSGLNQDTYNKLKTTGLAISITLFCILMIYIIILKWGDKIVPRRNIVRGGGIKGIKNIKIK